MAKPSHFLNYFFTPEIISFSDSLSSDGNKFNNFDNDDDDDEYDNNDNDADAISGKPLASSEAKENAILQEMFREAEIDLDKFRSNKESRNGEDQTIALQVNS